jgi:hypothetical protein
MSKKSLLEGLRDLERSEKPGTAAAQLREVKDEIDALLAKHYTQKQIWNCLTGRGLKLGFSGFKTFLYRMQEDVDESQKVSKSFEKCPHCGGELAAVGSVVDVRAGAETAADVQAGAAPAESSVDTSEPYEGLGSSFARSLTHGRLYRGLVGGNRRSDSGSN